MKKEKKKENLEEEISEEEVNKLLEEQAKEDELLEERFKRDKELEAPVLDDGITPLEKEEREALEVSESPEEEKDTIKWEEKLLELKKKILGIKFPIEWLLKLNHFTYKIWEEVYNKKAKEQQKFLDDYQDGYEYSRYGNYDTVDSCYGNGQRQSNPYANSNGADEFDNILDDVKNNSADDEKILSEFRKKNKR